MTACHYADLIFVLDGSGSVGSANFQRLLQFVTDVVNRFSVGLYSAQVSSLLYFYNHCFTLTMTVVFYNYCPHRYCSVLCLPLQIGVVEFGDTAKIEFNLNTYSDKASVIAAVRNIKWLDSETNTSGGIWYTSSLWMLQVYIQCKL